MNERMNFDYMWAADCAEFTEPGYLTRADHQYLRNAALGPAKIVRPIRLIRQRFKDMATLAAKDKAPYDRDLAGRLRHARIAANAGYGHVVTAIARQLA